MLHLRRAGLLDTTVKTVTGETLATNLDWWEQSERRHTLRKNLLDQDGIDPDNVIMSPDRARSRGLTSTVCFPIGNLAPEGSVIKSTAIDPALIDADNRYRHLGPAKVFTTEAAAIHAIKTGHIIENDVMVLICCGPAGAGMQEIYQITAALKALPFAQTRRCSYRRDASVVSPPEPASATSRPKPSREGHSANSAMAIR